MAAIEAFSGIGSHSKARMVHVAHDVLAVPARVALPCDKIYSAQHAIDRLKVQQDAPRREY
jgi:hypothetical protein